MCHHYDTAALVLQHPLMDLMAGVPFYFFFYFFFLLPVRFLTAFGFLPIPYLETQIGRHIGSQAIPTPQTNISHPS